VVSAPDDSPERIRELAAQGMSVRAIAMLTRASKSTVDRVVRIAA
jgi:IS30 family transposase